jgi:hypothetical protein
LIPSLLILVEVTLFFNESMAELGAGLTLTIMLVMYTIYQAMHVYVIEFKQSSFISQKNSFEVFLFILIR